MPQSVGSARVFFNEQDIDGVLAIDGAIQQRILGSLKRTDPQMPHSARSALSFLNQQDIDRSFATDFGHSAYRGNATKN